MVTTETARRVMNVDGKERDIKKENLHRRARCYTHAWWRGVSALLSVELAAIRRPLRFFAAVVFYYSYHGVISLYGSAMPVMALYGLNMKSDSGRPRAKASSTPSIGSSAFFFFCLSLT